MENTLAFIDCKSKESNKFRFTFFNIGIILFIILSQFNLAQWGATISYVAIPGVFFLLGAFFTDFKFDKNSFLIFLLFLAYFLSTLFSQYVQIERDMLSFFCFCLFFVFAVSHKYTIKEIRVFLIVYISVAIAASLIICFNWVTHNYIQEWVKRSTFTFMGVVKDPNYSFAYLCPAFALALLIFFFSKRKSIKLFCFIALAIIFVASFCASSRAAMLTMGITLILLPFLCTQLPTKTRILIFILTILVFALAFLIITQTFSEYALKRFTDDSDGAGRVEIWNYALRIFKSNPIFGGGFNSGSLMSLSNEGHTSHSVFIDILCDAGLLGIVAFLFFYFKNCFWPNWNNFEVQVVLSVSAITPLLFINGFNTTTFYFPLILLCLINHTLKEHNYSELFSYEDKDDSMK